MRRLIGIVLALHVGGFWRNFCRAVGQPELIDDERFRTTADRHANRTILGYVPKFTILGANYNPSVVFILANQLVRPEPGSRQDLQVADMVFQPLALGWHGDEWHATVSYNFWAPTERFNVGASNNTGSRLVPGLSATTVPC